MNQELALLQKEIEQIKERNRRVEANKAWETSITRKILIASLTYIVMVMTFSSMQTPEPFKNAIIPTVGFVLSTLSLPYFRKLWEKSKKS